MHGIVRYFLVLTFFLLSAANAAPKYSEVGVTDGFKTMLANPGSPAKAGESFATRVTRPRLDPMAEGKDLFSNPKGKRDDWNREYRAHTGKASISPLTIFETMGISRRGILNKKPPEAGHIFITRAQQTGMLGIITGDLGFRQRAATDAEKETMARELLNIGRSQDSGGYAPKLKTLFDDSKSSPAIKRHAQLSALLMLVGSGGEIEDREWYLTGLDKTVTLSKIKGYAARFLPRDDAAAVVAPKDVVISALMYNGRHQTIYGTSGIKVSGLHAALNYGRYPNIMALGSHFVPMQNAEDTFSIAAMVSPDRYFVVVGQPEICDDPVLRPHYMEIQADDPGSASGRGQTRVAVNYLNGKALENLTIDWEVEAPKAPNSAKPKNIGDLGAYIGTAASQVKPTEKGANDGQVHPDIIEDEFGEKTFSFVAHKQGPHAKHFYYWCPTPSQLRSLSAFANDNKSFTFEQLFEHISQFDPSDAVNPKMLEEIRQIKEGILAGFSR